MRGGTSWLRGQGARGRALMASTPFRLPSIASVIGHFDLTPNHPLLRRVSGPRQRHGRCMDIHGRPCCRRLRHWHRHLLFCARRVRGRYIQTCRRDLARARGESVVLRKRACTARVGLRLIACISRWARASSACVAVRLHAVVPARGQTRPRSLCALLTNAASPRSGCGGDGEGSCGSSGGEGGRQAVFVKTTGLT